ncbi:MAG: NosD domain-containing protein [Thermoanaerobaculia bacterium]
MKRLRTAPLFLALLVLTLLASSRASAQASRTWVSGVGDDANPCSRTAPCKTFAGAISKTATAGEINVLDPGGFGAVTITKSITISSEGFEAGVLTSAGGNGVIINAPTTALVVLRGLDFEGLGTANIGIRVIAAGTVSIEKCTINNFNNGINVEVAANVNLQVTDTILRNNGLVSVGNSAGIAFNPTGAAIVTAALNNVRLDHNFNGLFVEQNAKISARDVTAIDSPGSGFFVTSPSADLNLDGAVASGNGTGIRTSGATSTVRMSNTLVTGNNLGLAPTTGNILSFVNNRIAGNTTDGAPSGTLAQQ